MTVDDFAQFLTDRYDEAEALALGAGEIDGSGLSWRQYDAERAPGKIIDEHGSVIVYDEGSPTAEEAAFIVANDPKRRLADIKLKRAILAMHVSTVATEPPYPNPITGETVTPPPNGDCFTCGWFELERGGCATVRQLGTEFDQHPAYKESWKP